MTRGSGAVLAMRVLWLVWCVVAKEDTCDCSRYREATAGALGGFVPRSVAVPPAFSAPLSTQLVLIKIPETGSSTAANMLTEIAAKRSITCWYHGGPLSFEQAIERPNASGDKWALAHLGYGPWVEKHFDKAKVKLVTTTRDPAARLHSWAGKHAKLAGPFKCLKGASVALRFWASERELAPPKNGARDTPGERLMARYKGLGTAKVAEKVLSKFDDVWIMERYNESLVSFALSHRLSLGDVIPPLAKYHGHQKHGGAPNDHRLLDAQESARVRAQCLKEKVEETADFALESKIHKVASDALDAKLDALRKAGVPVDDLVALFSRHLNVAMTEGVSIRDDAKIDKANHGTTLIMSNCARKCASLALDDAARLDFGPASFRRPAPPDPAPPPTSRGG